MAVKAVALITLIVLLLAGWVLLKPKPAVPVQLETKIINLGKVVIAATPLVVKPNQPLVFKLTFTTHSVELSYDFKQAVTVEDDKGNAYSAKNWSGGYGGHHLEGELTLAPLKSGAKGFKLKFSGIDQEGGELIWPL